MKQDLRTAGVWVTIWTPRSTRWALYCLLLTSHKLHFSHTHTQRLSTPALSLSSEQNRKQFSKQNPIHFNIQQDSFSLVWFYHRLTQPASSQEFFSYFILALLHTSFWIFLLLFSSFWSSYNRLSNSFGPLSTFKKLPWLPNLTVRLQMLIECRAKVTPPPLSIAPCHRLLSYLECAKSE